MNQVDDNGQALNGQQLLHGARVCDTRVCDTRVVRNLQTLLQHSERFATVLLDPPWRYDNAASRGAAAKHYPTMSLEEIANLPIDQLATEDAHLHLWTTDDFDAAAISLMAKWNFTYKSRLVWHKESIGCGNYYRLTHEFLLLGIRGTAPFPRHDIPSIVKAKRQAHSVKPSLFRSLIEEVSPAPRLELFARSTAPGWTVWGHEIQPTLFDEP